MNKQETVSFHTVFFLTAIFSMLAVLFFVFTFSARSIILSKELLNQKIEVRGVQCLDKAGLTITDIINEKAHIAAENEYNSLLSECNSYHSSNSLSENDALEKYRENYFAFLEKSLSRELISSALEKRFKPEKGKIELDEEQTPTLKANFDEETGEMISLTLENLMLRYTYGNNYEQSREYNYEIEIPYGVFFDGNDDLFDFSMISQKGLYITGKTSSIVGNVYAGTHSVSEYRKAESGYGERKIYGGINVMSTQLGIDADKIISTGEINLKGSFVAFGTDEDPITIYSGDINELPGLMMSSSYNLFGEIRPRNGAEYVETVNLINSCEGLTDNYSYYYDSDNDESYKGKYRKIISGTDVNITGDFTGVVITSGNIIIEADANVEGFIYAEDRIYVQGNNNIVSNRDIMREIIADELSREDIDSSYMISEYLGELRESGLQEPPEIMVKIVQ